MVGTLVNTATVLIGSSLGCLLNRNFPEKYKLVFFQAIGLFNIVLGVKMGLEIQSSLIFLVFALVLGGFTGEWIDLDKRTQSLGDILKSRFKLKNERFTEGFVTAFLLFCMGSMAIVGSIEEGFGKTSDLLLTKAMMDLFSSFMLASALGVGVVFSSLAVLVFQGGITLLVMLFGKEIPDVYVAGVTSVGGIMLIGLGISLIGLKNIKVINLLPALIYICLFIFFSQYFNF